MGEVIIRFEVSWVDEGVDENEFRGIGCQRSFINARSLDILQSYVRGIFIKA